MKILITTDLYTTATNGVVTSVKNLTEELVRKGHDVRILTLSEGMKSRREGNVYYIRSMPLGIYPNVRMPLSYRHALIRELIDWAPDVIHSQCEFFSFQFAKRISKRTGAPIVHTYHTLYEQYVTYVIPNKRLGRKIVRILSRKRLKQVSTVIVPTRKVEDALLSYGLDNEIQVIPSGISLSQHKKRLSDTERERGRAALGIGEEELVLLNLGRLGTEKNLEELISFYARAVKENQKLRFVIVGDGPAKEDLERLAHKLGLADKVIFTGMVDPGKVQEYYQLCDIFVSASTSETQGLTYIEAAANGLPLLCREDKCLADIIEAGVNGYEYTDAQSFITALETVFSDPEWREAAGRAGEEIAESFDTATFGDRVEEVYNSVIDDEDGE